jgi:hypothetical protein
VKPENLTKEELEMQERQQLDMEKGTNKKLKYLINKLEAMDTILKSEDQFEKAVTKDDFEIEFEKVREEQK